MKKIIIKILIAILNNPAISKSIADSVLRQIDQGHPLVNWMDYHIRYNNRLIDAEIEIRKRRRR